MKTLSRRQLVKQRKRQRLIESSNELKISYKIALKPLLAYLSSASNPSLNDIFEFKFWSAFLQINFEHKGLIIKNCPNLFGILRENFLNKRSDYNSYVSMFYSRRNRAGKEETSIRRIKREFVFLYGQFDLEELFYDCDISDKNNSNYFESMISKREKINIRFLEDKDCFKNAKRMDLFLDKEVFFKKLLNVLKEVLRHIKATLKELIDKGVLSKEIADEKYIRLCASITGCLYDKRTLSKKQLHRLKDRNSLLNNVIGKLQNGLNKINPFDSKKDNEFELLYGLSYSYANKIRRRRGSISTLATISNHSSNHQPNSNVGIGSSVGKVLKVPVTPNNNGKSLRYIKLSVFENYLRGVFELEEFKDENGKVKKEYYKYKYIMSFIRLINKGIL